MALFGGPSQPVTRLEELKRLLQRDPTSRQFLALAEEFRRHGKYRDAVITLERGLALHTNSVAGHVALGKTYQQLDRLEDAIRAFNNALRIDRENLVAIRQLAEVYLAKGDKIEAIKKLKLYRGLKAGDRDVNDIIARLEQEMTAAVGERAGFRSGARPAVEAPPAFVPGPGFVEHASPRRSAQEARDARARCDGAPLPGGAAARRPDGVHVRRRVDRARSGGARPMAAPPAPPPPAPPPPLDDLFLQTTPEPAAPPSRPARSLLSRRRFARCATRLRRWTARLAPAPFEVSPPEVDLDDVPTAPFQFPVDLYRVGSAPEPAAALPEAPAPAAAPPPAAAPEPAPAVRPNRRSSRRHSRRCTRSRASRRTLGRRTVRSPRPRRTRFGPAPCATRPRPFPPNAATARISAGSPGASRSARRRRRTTCTR